MLTAAPTGPQRRGDCSTHGFGDRVLASETSGNTRAASVSHFTAWKIITNDLEVFVPDGKAQGKAGFLEMALSRQAFY